jgi:hypothetical protein
MTVISRLWRTVVQVASWLTLSPVSNPDQSAQYPLGFAASKPPIAEYPIFRPPAANPEDDDFQCVYPAMEGFFQCSIPENREYWLRHRDGREFNIHTDYDKFAPVGITRNFTLNVTDGWINADGQPFDHAKLFNEQYPGPWLEACWGDVSTLVALVVMKADVRADSKYHCHQQYE